MGMHQNITHNKFPEQRNQALEKRVKVYFHYDTKPEHAIKGTFVRDDIEAPYIGIIKLDNGNYVLITECQYSYISSEAE